MRHTMEQSGGIHVITHTAYTLRLDQISGNRVITCSVTQETVVSSNRLTFEVIHLQHLQCSMLAPIIKSTSQYPPGGGWMVMEPIVPAGLFGLVSGRVLTLEINTFAARNTNPNSHILPLLDISHYSSDIVEG